MYGLPEHFDATPLVAQRLVQICFGVGQIQFHFDKKLTISVTSPFLYGDPAAPEAERVNIPGSTVVQCRILGLLHRAILKAHGTEDGSLILEFDGGYTLQLLDENPAYEAYEIRLGDDLIIV